MKLLEQQHSIVTQHVSLGTMSKALRGDGGAGLVLDNILMKTNLKLGGLCHVLRTPAAMQRMNPGVPRDLVCVFRLGPNHS